MSAPETAPILCPECRGSGYKRGDSSKPCPKCDGWGRVIGPAVLQRLTAEDYEAAEGPAS